MPDVRSEIGAGIFSTPLRSASSLSHSAQFIWTGGSAGAKPAIDEHNFLNESGNRIVERVCFRKVFSDRLKVVSGVLQGPIPGPLLFSLYVNSMPSAVTDGTVDLFADDTTVTVCGKTANEVVDKLCIAIDQISGRLETNRLVLNFNKTNFMIKGAELG